jgi:hypothetical protein
MYKFSNKCDGGKTEILTKLCTEVNCWIRILTESKWGSEKTLVGNRL